MDPNFPNPAGAELRQAYEAVERAENLLAETQKVKGIKCQRRKTKAIIAP
jgi:hypothetical protein